MVAASIYWFVHVDENISYWYILVNKLWLCIFCCAYGYIFVSIIIRLYDGEYICLF